MHRHEPLSSSLGESVFVTIEPESLRGLAIAEAPLKYALPNRPILILTLRRTGGTTLASVLFGANRTGKSRHEPFNQDREFGSITASFRADGNVRRLRTRIAKALTTPINIKHAVDTVPHPVTRVLVHEASLRDFSIVALLRRSERARLLSLAVARATGAWGLKQAQEKYRDLREGGELELTLDIKAIHRDIRNATQSIGVMLSSLAASRAEYTAAFFEDLYTGAPDQRIASAQRLFGGLGANSDGQNELVDALMATRGQETDSIIPLISNTDEAMTLFEDAGIF